MKLAFLGSGTLGSPTLQALADAEQHVVAAVFTQPDRPAGRGHRLKPTPIKQRAQSMGLPIHQAEDVNRHARIFRQLRLEAIVVAAFGQILSRELLETPSHGAINLHASLLPEHRGAAPVPWALLRGDSKTGVTTFLMDQGLDTGPILLQRELPIREDDTAGTLEERLAERGAELMLDTLNRLQDGTVTPQPQDHSKATHAPKIGKEQAEINWTRDARSLFSLIRAFNPRPGAFTYFREKRLKVHFAKVVDDSARGEQGGSERRPGQIVARGTSGPIVQTGEGTLELTHVQPAGKRPISGMDFARGYRITEGETLG